MAGHRKSNEDIAASFFVTKTEISRFFGINKKVAKEVFERAQQYDIEDLGIINYFDETKVRLTTVVKTLGLSMSEVERKKRKEKET